MGKEVDPRKQYRRGLAAQILNIARMKVDPDRDAAIDAFYKKLHQFDQPLTYGTARTEYHGLLDLTAAVDMLTDVPDDMKVTVAGIATQIRERSYQDDALRGLDLPSDEL